MPLVRMRRSMVVVVRVENEVDIVGRFRGKGEVRSGMLFGGVEFCGEVR